MESWRGFLETLHNSNFGAAQAMHRCLQDSESGIGQDAMIQETTD